MQIEILWSYSRLMDGSQCRDVLKMKIFHGRKIVEMRVWIAMANTTALLVAIGVVCVWRYEHCSCFWRWCLPSTITYSLVVAKRCAWVAGIPVMKIPRIEASHWRHLQLLSLNILRTARPGGLHATFSSQIIQDRSRTPKPYLLTRIYDYLLQSWACLFFSVAYDRCLSRWFQGHYWLFDTQVTQMIMNLLRYCEETAPDSKHI